MSWDVILEKPLPGCQPGDMDGENIELFDLAEVERVLRALLPQIQKTGTLEMFYDEPSVAIEINLAEDYIWLFVHYDTDEGGTRIMELLREICKALQCRAMDTTEVEFIV